MLLVGLTGERSHQLDSSPYEKEGALAEEPDEPCEELEGHFEPQHQLSTISIAASMAPAGTGMPSRVQVALTGSQFERQSTILVLHEGRSSDAQHASCILQQESAQLGPVRECVSTGTDSSQLSSERSIPLHQFGPQ